jgi:hypothetical protein
MTYINIDEIETNILDKINTKKTKILDNKTKLLTSLYEFEKKYLTKLIETDELELKKYIIKAEERIAFYCCYNLYINRNKKQDIDNKNYYNYLIRWSNYNKIYKSYSDTFLSLGIYAGIYIDILQFLKISKKQVNKEYIIVNNICSLFIIQQQLNTSIEYTFLNFLFKMLNYSDIINFIFESIYYIEYNNYNNQIGCKNVKNTKTIVYYLRYGLPYIVGMTCLTQKQINIIKYCIIFNCNENLPLNEIEIKNDGLILIPVENINGIYKINNKYKNINININKNVVSKIVYIIDIKKLYTYYNKKKYNMQQNDIGYIIVNKNIPIDCIIEITTINAIKF